MTQKTDKFWQEFLAETNRQSDTVYYEAFYFGSNEQSANELLELVLKGRKKATASSVQAYALANEPFPEIGELSIVTDWQGNPYCVIQTTNVTRMAFKDMTYDMCKREGEDKNLASWQKNHISFFKDEGSRVGYEFSWDMEIIFEDFEVIYQ